MCSIAIGPDNDQKGPGTRAPGELQISDITPFSLYLWII